MEKWSTEGLKQDRLLIVCFGSPDSDIYEKLHVFNFLNFCFLTDSFAQCTDCLFIQPIFKRCGGLYVWNRSVSVWQAAPSSVCTEDEIYLLFLLLAWTSRSAWKAGYRYIFPATRLSVSMTVKVRHYLSLRLLAASFDLQLPPPPWLSLPLSFSAKVILEFVFV